MRFFSSLFLLIALCLPVFSQNGHEIKVSPKGYQENVLYLAYHYGNKQYVADTVYRQADNSFVFKGDEPLEPGNYILVFAPDNQSFDFLIDKSEQQFSLSFDYDNMLETVELTNSSDENKRFFGYLKFLGVQRKEVEAIQSEDSGSSDGTQSSADQQKRLEAINIRVSAYQQKLIADHPDSFTAAIVKASLPIDYPEFEGTESEKQAKAWRYAQKHYLDNINLADERLIRTALLHPRVDYFVQKLQVQNPDTISAAIDYILPQMQSAKENYKYFVIHFLNKYAKSKVIGMDAVYVHMAEKYYTDGKAPWTEPDQLEKILDNAAKLKPILIGKTAPDVEIRNRAGIKFNLHDLEADYTVLYFWRFDCKNCQETTPDLKKFYDEFKDKGVKILAICTKGPDELEGCWNYADEQGISDWIHVSSLPGQGQATSAYDVRATPQIFLLDKDKVIISKRLAVSQLSEIMTRFMK